MTFSFKRLKIPDVILVETKTFPDNRGFFLENFKESVFVSNSIKTRFVQDNLSNSIRGVLRGLHYQKNPNAQAKLVTSIKGEIFDVAVDIRTGSATFGKWVAEILSEKNHNSLFIPEGFAHGFCVLSDEADVLYKVNQEYSPEHEKGIIWNDPQIDIKWPIKNPIISKKDEELPLLKDADFNFVY